MIKDLFYLLRVPNLIFITILLYVMENWVAVPILNLAGIEGLLPWWIFTLLTVATVLVAAGGYVINDYFDVKIDRINRPDQLVVTRSITKEQTMYLFIGLTLSGIILGLCGSAILRSSTLAGIYILTPGLLWFYSSSYKRQFIIGNLIIGFCSAVTPLLIAIANACLLVQEFGKQMEFAPLSILLYAWLGGFSVFAFFCTWIREIIKDLQDQKGDREMECHTIPIKLGNTWAKIIVTILIVFVMGAIVYLNYNVLPFDHSWNSFSTRYVRYGLLIPLICELVLLWSARTPNDYKNSQGLMKFIMMLGVLYSFVILKQLVV